MYSYDDLLLFLKVAEIGSFSKTAKILKVSHTTISRRIKALENKLGTHLISYRGNSFELTTIAKEIFTRLKSHLFNFEDSVDILDSIIKNKNNITTHLKIILPPILSRYKITPFIPMFLRKYPNIKLDIYYNAEEIDLVKNGIDLAITHIFPHYQTQKVRSIYKSSMCFYCTKAYKDKYGIPLTLDELSNHIFGAYSGDFFEAPVNGSLINLSNQTMEPYSNISQIRINDSNNSFNLIETGEVISPIFKFQIEKLSEIERDKIIHVLPEYELFPYEYFLLKHPYMDGQALNLLTDFLLQLFSDTSKV